MSDVINHPEHYEGSTSLECIDCMRLIFGDPNVAQFCIINAFKYLWRHKNKNKAEDIGKAQWYLKKYFELDPYSEYDALYSEVKSLVESAELLYSDGKLSDQYYPTYEELKEKLAAYEAVGSVNYFKTLVEMQEALEDDGK